MKKTTKYAFIISFLTSIVLPFLVLWCSASKIFATEGLLLTITGILQLEITGFFDRFMQEYGNEDKYPFGPPSYITREIIDNPDTPLKNLLTYTLFYSRDLGVMLLVSGCIFGIGAIWI